METEKVKKLMLLLNTMLDKKKDNEEDQANAISKLTSQIMRMLENDEDLQQSTIFAKTGKFKAIKFCNLSEQDKAQIIEQNARKMAEIPKNYQPSLATEIANKFNANKINIKFVAMKTPANVTSIRFPRKV